MYSLHVTNVLLLLYCSLQMYLLPTIHSLTPYSCQRYTLPSTDIIYVVTTSAKNTHYPHLANVLAPYSWQIYSLPTTGKCTHSLQLANVLIAYKWQMYSLPTAGKCTHSLSLANVLIAYSWQIRVVANSLPMCRKNSADKSTLSQQLANILVLY